LCSLFPPGFPAVPQYIHHTCGTANAYYALCLLLPYDQGQLLFLQTLPHPAGETLALLLTLGSANTWYKDFHPISYGVIFGTHDMREPRGSDAANAMNKQHLMRLTRPESSTFGSVGSTQMCTPGMGVI